MLLGPQRRDSRQARMRDSLQLYIRIECRPEVPIAKDLRLPNSCVTFTNHALAVANLGRKMSSKMR